MERLGAMVKFLEGGVAAIGVRGKQAAMSLFPCENCEGSQAGVCLAAGVIFGFGFSALHFTSFVSGHPERKTQNRGTHL
jgi:hypothetical protein